MPLVGRLAAQWIQRAGLRVDVRHLLDEAVLPQPAIDRQAQPRRLTSFGERWQCSIANDRDANCESEMIQAPRHVPVRQAILRTTPRRAFQYDNSRGDESRPAPRSRQIISRGYKDFSAKTRREVFRILRIAEAEDNPDPVIGTRF
jgi:hypothetical protein